MNWRTPLYWFFCKIGDPIWSPSLFGKCCYCKKVHGRSDYAKQYHIELGRMYQCEYCKEQFNNPWTYNLHKTGYCQMRPK